MMVMLLQHDHLALIFRYFMEQRGQRKTGQLGEDFNRVRANVLELVKTTLRPEFVNRVDEFVVFKPLSREHHRDIVQLEIDKVSQSGERCANDSSSVLS